MTLVFYVSGHGFGHASRVVEVINAIGALDGETNIVVRSAVPEWLIRTARVPVEVQRAEVDTGMTQLDGIRHDEDASARHAHEFYRGFKDRVEHEAGVLRAARAGLIVSDIPPLGSVAAREAGIPSIALGNFTWDWIYGAYPQFERLAPGTLNIIRRAYATTTLALRLPLHGGFDTMPQVCDMPLVARTASVACEETRARLGIRADGPVVLASFGGYGLDMPYDEVVSRNGLTVIMADSLTESTTAFDGRVRSIARSELTANGLRYEDLLASCDVVVSKPGYGIASECIANGRPLLYTSRGRFIEQDVFDVELPRLLRCRFIPQADLLAGRWEPAIRMLMDQPPPPERIATNGADVVARRILDLAYT